MKTLTRMLLMSFFLAGCSSPAANPQLPKPETLDVGCVDGGTPDPSPPDAAVPEARNERWLLDLRGVALPVEASTLRAATAWEERTGGRVTFRALRADEPVDCKTPTIRVFDRTDVLPPLDPGWDEGLVGAHIRFPGTECVAVVVRASWASEPNYMAMFERTKENPFVAVASHEIGHVLGLAHVGTTERSVMGPQVNLLPVSEPTCEDVSLLAESWGEPIRCRELLP